MAPTRKSPERLCQGVKLLLNRPEDDDFFEWPEEYLAALSKAHRRIYQKIAQHAPNLILVDATVTTSDGGWTYALDDFQMGLIEVYQPPGPPTGPRIPPANPDSAHFGFWIDGTTLKLTRPMVFAPLHIRWAPETLPDLQATGTDTHVLPAYCEDMLEYEAAFLMANKSGFAGNPQQFSMLANRQWVGDPADESDMGILGTIKRLAMNQGYEAHAGAAPIPWYRGIG